MPQCRFHVQSEAVSYCGTCRALFCQRCGVPGKTCSLCKRTALVAPPSERMLEAHSKAQRCFKHPKEPGAKSCHECGTPRCPQCLNWQGICPACAPKFPANGAEPDAEEPKAKRGRRKAKKPDLSYTGGLNRHKGWQRSAKRMVLGALLLAGIGWILQFQFGVFKEFATKAGETRKKMQGMQALNAGNARNADLSSMMQRLESGEVTNADVEATERLMARIEAGESVDGGQRDALTKLSRLYQSGKAPEASDPQSQKMWALLSEWSNDSETEAEAPRASRPAARPAARSRQVQPAQAQAVPWKVALLSPVPGARVQGLVSVSARIEGQGYIDRVEFLVNGEWQGLSNRPPFRFDWDTTGGGNGAKTLEVVAYEPSGARHASRKVRVTVAN